MTTHTIATTILQQLGGNRFVAMTGARQIVAGPEFLQFAIGRGAVNHANKVRVTLEPTDTYCVEFFYCRGVDCRQCGDSLRGIYADQLREVFTSQTGMDTHL